MNIYEYEYIFIDLPSGIMKTRLQYTHILLINCSK